MDTNRVRPTEQVLPDNGTHHLTALVINEILQVLERFVSVVSLSHVLSRDDAVLPAALDPLDFFSVYKRSHGVVRLLDRRSRCSTAAVEGCHGTATTRGLLGEPHPQHTLAGRPARVPGDTEPRDDGESAAVWGLA